MRTLILATLALAVPLSLLGASPAHAAGSCTILDKDVAACWGCSAGEKLTVAVTGLNTVGTVTGCGASVDCRTTGLAYQCTYTSGTLSTGAGQLFWCMKQGRGMVTCSSG